MSSPPDDLHGHRLWRSLEELADAEGARERLAAEFSHPAEPGAVDRRRLLQLMAGSLALGGLAGCAEPREELLYSRPQNLPGHARGEPIVFATTLGLNGLGRGVLVKTFEGRPVKIEGNTLHPASLGATDVWAQAEVLSLYDPDRALAPRGYGAERSWAELLAFIAAEREVLGPRRGRGLRVLSEPVASPSRLAAAEAVRAAYPEAVWHHYGAVMDDHARAGALQAFGRPADTVLDLSQADALLCLGGDLFLKEPGYLRHAADWIARRREGRGVLPRLTVAEATPGITGARADRRVVLRPGEFESFARAVLAEVDGRVLPADGSVHPEAALVAAELGRVGARGLVTVGREQPTVVHALGHALNARLGAVDTTMQLIEPVNPLAGGEVASLLALAEAIAAGSVSHLLVLGGNPAYDAPADLGFADLIRRVPVSAHLAFGEDETSAACRWHIPARHALESWGDLRSFDGTVGLQQQATTPPAPCWSAEELLLALAGRAPDARELVRSVWRERWADVGEERWLAALEAGVVPDTASPPLDLALRPDWDPGPTARGAGQGITAVFTPDASVWDGAYANNAWLQELPDPLTKQVWGNAALLAPATASQLGLETGDVAVLRAGGRELEAPVWVMPGHAPDTVTLPLGYGRERAGRIGGRIGFDATRLRFAASPWSLEGVEIVKAGRREELISTQSHHWLDGDDAVRIVASADTPVADAADRPQPSLYPEVPYEGHAWGMAIDLDACIGCNACVIACQAENNVPVVGPEEVARGREMHWLRVDRYHSGSPDDPGTAFQPVPCMHCEKAPCEIVCPVNATVHSSEGLNDMVYNRCVGTRTCSNNCPYKVRRFNWFDYTGGAFGTVAAVENPQVTVRDRGVMEKCTYCVQRISERTIAARLEDRPLRDGEIQTACQQACPTHAIVFGDLNDKGSLVSRMRASPRNYALLGHLNTQPRTTYLARVEP